MRKLSLFCCGIILALCLGPGGRPAFAVTGTIDNVPAATLLLPYFEVGVNDENDVNTVFSINNSFVASVLAQVTIWSDQSVPVLGFNVYLTGYDVQTVDLRDILINGNLPVTASAGQDPGDTISPQGVLSQDINYSSCSTLPYPPGAVSAAIRSHLQAWLQGLPSPMSASRCAGFDHDPAPRRQGDGILRGYVTVDTVAACNLFFPSDWSNYRGYLTNQNVLWGDYAIYNDAEDTAFGETLVHIESDPSAFVQGDHTFYGRYNGANADDAREPLPTTTAARFTDGGTFSGGTDFLIWREANASASPYPCTSPGPTSWFPLQSMEIVIFDEEEQAVAVNSCHSSNPFCVQDALIPNEANRSDAVIDLLAPFNSGWVYLNLQHHNAGFQAIYGDRFAQSWTTVLATASGRFSIGYDALQLDNANTPNLQVLFP